MILIAGAGLAGLSTAFHLGDREYRIIETGPRPGGLCRTERVGDHVFDYGGHLLHLRGDDVAGLVKDLLGDRLISHRRRASIYSSGVLTPYPFQVNTHGLPPQVIRECLLGFIKATLSYPEGKTPDNFSQWILRTFGEGFARHFFFPFNRKFFKSDLETITADWVDWSIPRPSLEQVVNGALGVEEGEFGYNVEFFYPRGGIEQLPLALASELARPVETGTSLVEVVPEEKRAVLSSGEEICYDQLVSTVPLDRLLSMLRGAPREITEVADRLRVLSVFCVNLGCSGPPVSDRHWIYVPGQEFSFHRIGFFSNYMEGVEGKSSLYLEITAPGPVSSHGGEPSRAVEEFRAMPMWSDGSRELKVAETFVIEHGYVVYDSFRREHLPAVMDYLQDHGIEPAGRYARWEYSTMEDAIRQGRVVAERITG